MVFKKPYAFLVKYFKLINFILAVFMGIILYRVSLLHQVLDDIYTSTLSNYSSLQSIYLGFSTYLFLIIECLLLAIVIVLLKKKNKPLRDYLIGVLYLIILVVFFFSVSSLFLKLDSVVIDPASLKVYSDISLLIMFPAFYLIFVFSIIAIGFNLKKFNFTKDIIELKKEEDDNEEIELVFAKDTYKYKRGIRRYIREMKYYISENRLYVYIILGIVGISLFSTVLGMNIFNTSKVKVNETFVAGAFSYNVGNAYESKQDLYGVDIKNGFKFVVVNVNVRNNLNISSRIDFDRIRLFYGDEYVYANNYYNSSFSDLGTPYNNELLAVGENVDYIFIFKVPESYKSNKYTLKFYDKNVYVEEEINADYKVVKIKSTKLDTKINTVNMKLKELSVFDKKLYGNSNLIINSYDVVSSYKYKDGNLTKLVTPKDSNSTLLVIDYNLKIDKNSLMLKHIKKDRDFFKNFIKITYDINDKSKTIKSTDILNLSVENKVFINVPFNFRNAKNMKFIISFRDIQYIYSTD